MHLFTRVSPNPDRLSYPLSFFSFQPPCRALYCTTYPPPERPCTSASLLDPQLHPPSRPLFQLPPDRRSPWARTRQTSHPLYRRGARARMLSASALAWVILPSLELSVVSLPSPDVPLWMSLLNRFALLLLKIILPLVATPPWWNYTTNPCVSIPFCSRLTAPWFCNLGVRDPVSIENKFADGAGMLPGHLPLMAIHSYDWRSRIAIPPSILRGSSSQGRHALSARFMSTVCDRLELPLTDGLIPASYFCDTWQYRTGGERSYLDSMIIWTAGDPIREANRLWHNQRTATNQAMFWTQPIIPGNFRHLKRDKLPFFQCTGRAERRLRSDTGYFIAYHMLEAREIARDHYTNRYQKIPSWWGQFEVPGF